MLSVKREHYISIKKAMPMKNWIKIAGLLLFSLPIAAQAEDFTYTTNNGAITITKYIGLGGDVTIPGTIEGLPVSVIGDSAFLNYTNLTSITIGASITNIGNSAFGFCTSLMTITVATSNSAYSSIDGVLLNKSQTTLILCPEGKTGTYTSPDSVTNIMDWAFSFCSALTSITISDSVTSIGYGAFSYCTSLSDVTIGNSVASIGIKAFMWCTSLTNVMIGKNVTSIGHSAFWYCESLTNVTIPDSVTSINGLTFSHCEQLVTVSIGNSVTNIGNSAFASCTRLMEVYFQDNAPSIGAGVFTFTTKATVYYLPGTTGWETTFGERPTVLWNPQIQTGDGSLGVSTNGFGFNIAGTNNFTVVVEACTNLVSGIWIPVKTSTLTGGSVQFSDPAFTNYPSRYYRVSMPQ